MHILKKKLRERVKSKLSFTQEALAQEFLPDVNVNNLHDAIEDIKVLKNLVDKLEVSCAEIIDECKSHQQLNDQEKINKIKKNSKMIVDANKKKLKFLEGAVSKKIIHKMAKEGITEQILLDVYNSDSINGIKILLSMSVNNRVRITSSTKIINSICDTIKNKFN